LIQRNDRAPRARQNFHVAHAIGSLDMFARNVGTIDRLLRIVVGVMLIVLAAYGRIGPWGYIGVVPLLTGLSSRCPAYSLLGVSTCPRG
jgi:hypothetical protein